MSVYLYGSLLLLILCLQILLKPCDSFVVPNNNPTKRKARSCCHSRLETSVGGNEKTQKRKRRAPRKTSKSPGQDDSSSRTEIWRIYGIAIHPDDLEKSSSEEFPVALQKALQKKMKSDQLPPTKVVRRSFDARRKLDHPTFSYVVDVSVKASQAKKLGWKVQPGKMERILEKQTVNANNLANNAAPADKKKTVIIVGAGPAGLFCALQLALRGDVKPILIDRGQPVERRGRDIGALIHRRSLDSESNFAFGEGGAGTWSDGKLTTRIGRNSEHVRWILETFVKYGAPQKILWEGAPHLGTDNLVRLLRNMRNNIKELGGEIHFGTKMTDLIVKDGIVEGVTVVDTDGQKVLHGDAIVLAAGHSARDVYESLHHAGVQLEPKGFAVGFRIEHPQKLINQIQYGDEWGPCVKTGKSKTDEANQEYFPVKPQHAANLPVASYRLATDKADDGSGNRRGVYSFCMCPGGQIVPSSTEPDEMCVNGMSFSRRDSVWANSALVVTVSPDDEILEEYRSKFGVLAGLEFQRDMERCAAKLGGGNFTVPVQRVTDFVDGKVSATIPSSSYRLGVQSAPCHEIYPAPITNALKDALVNYFSRQMPGYYHEDGLLHAVETRTSSPVRVSRDRKTCQAIGSVNLFPAGEGAGFAGGIVSAAVDGMVVSEAVLDLFYGTSRPGRVEKSKSIGFSY